MLAIEGVMPPQHPREFRVSGRAPSVDDDASDTLARFGSDQACLRHETTTAYRCFLPDLTGFAGRFCTGPDRQRRCARAGSAVPDLGRGFSPAGADCGYRAPLAPRLARPRRWYRPEPGSARDPDPVPGTCGHRDEREERDHAAEDQWPGDLD